MKFLLLSDSHHNLRNLEIIFQSLDLNSFDYLIHCGDVNDEETVDFLVKNFPNKIRLVWGNADKNIIDKDWKEIYKKDWKNQRIIFYENIGEFQINNDNIAITHFPGRARKLFESKKYKYTFYGHTHKPYIEDINNEYWLLNPGNVAGLYYPASFTIWHYEKNNFQLVLLKELINKK